MLFTTNLASRILTRRFIACSQFTTSLFHTIARAMAAEYKIKGLSSLDLKSGEKREVEVEGIEEGKVLLANSGGKIHALSAKCTHYGGQWGNSSKKALVD